MTDHTPTVLSIAGADPYGGAGIQADLKSIHALGGYALTCVTALTAQNSQGVRCVYPTSADCLAQQLHALLTDLKVDAVKIGMLANAELIEVVAEILSQYSLNNIVLDTPFISSSGHPLLEASAIQILKQRLFPKVTVITPNLPELNYLLNRNSDNAFQATDAEMAAIGQAFFKLGAKAIVVKGGHAHSTAQVTDTLLQPESEAVSFTSPRIHTQHTHGTGCSFSSAIACLLAKGQPLPQAVKNAKQQMHQWLTHSESLQLRYHQPQSTRREPLKHLST